MVRVSLSEQSYRDKLVHADPRWSAFNGSFQNVELEPLQFAEQAWEGKAFTTWHKDNWRTTANYLLGQHIGLDFDTKDRRSKLEILLEEPFIQQYASFLYTTPSHTDKEPRCRVIFILDEPIYQASNYVLAATSLIWLFAGVSDRKVKDAVRFFYGAGEDCGAAFPGQILPLSKMRQIIEMYKITGTQTRARTKRPLRSKSPGEQEIISALAAIPPWSIDYHDWVGILMAIHAAMPNSRGLRVAEHWADGDKGEVAAKWKGFKVDGGYKPDTIFYFAGQNGWKYERN